MKTTVISILILSFFSSNVAGVKPSRGLLPARRPELHPLASKELPPIPGICLMVMVPAKSTEKPRQVCKAVEGSEYKVGFHIPSKVYEESCDAQSPAALIVPLQR
ncbi:hypothetical protein BDV38DRAFT_278235 [Aspergillus pseudotamarii]|uniref:Uncharacterized protein n=1 Tax=Aspergillus pseudotamarii TaxID=132259 RepID=A0A5N6T962_ASPPS|nr:uncharacterized protein BDV38DRAFT_278235 [Aspergillus pseudotamarii]KAE8142719.1 hypothetical protein BDV38DRAFT_278235 [Aspergillus pseudotamarii]